MGTGSEQRSGLEGEGLTELGVAESVSSMLGAQGVKGRRQISPLAADDPSPGARHLILRQASDVSPGIGCFARRHFSRR